PDAGQSLQEPAVAEEREEADLEHEPDERAERPHEPRIAAEALALLRPERAVVARDDPVGRALVDRDLLGGLRDLRDELDRRGAVADHRDVLAGDVAVVVPARRVEARALEARESRDVREVRAIELAHAGDDRVGDDLFAGREPDPPDAARLVEV